MKKNAAKKGFRYFIFIQYPTRQKVFEVQPGRVDDIRQLDDLIELYRGELQIPLLTQMTDIQQLAVDSFA